MFAFVSVRFFEGISPFIAFAAKVVGYCDLLDISHWLL